MADQNVNNQSVTWNNGATTFDAIKMNVTDTASAAASRLILLQVGGVDRMYVRKDGFAYFLGDIQVVGGDVIGLVDGWHGFLEVPTNKAYTIVLKAPFAGTISETVTKCTSGTCTATFAIDGVSLGGTANAVSSAEQTQAHASANAFAAGTDIKVTVSANAACLDMAFTVKFARTAS